MNNSFFNSILLILVIAGFNSGCQLPAPATGFANEPHRPQIHFSPKEHWTNDPNGMVYFNGVFHLFFQYYPDSTVWGPMHWGHATSTDLVHWEEQPIALYPDSLGYIFSGSAVADYNNTSGFGENGKVPLVAIFTHHLPDAPEGSTDFQNQSLAYSLDEGSTWTKYKGNPVLRNPGIADFRDPKVIWYEQDKKWIMTLAVKDRIMFYSSPNLKDWTKESEFGDTLGAHGGVWECPDLFTLDHDGKKIWVLIVNLNPGGPNGGSATQYFTGDFDGHVFTPGSTATKWLDYGPDEYAGITWSNTGDRKIFLGWMSNWIYANTVPTVKWRNAMTIPRELALKEAGGQLYVTSAPIHEFSSIAANKQTLKALHINDSFDLKKKLLNMQMPCRLDIALDTTKDFSIVLSNTLGEELVIGYETGANRFYIDRANAGKSSFDPSFAAKHTAPRFTNSPQLNMTLFIDISSVELFADDGLTVMTEIFFPNENYRDISIRTNGTLDISQLKYAFLESIWKKAPGN